MATLNVLLSGTARSWWVAENSKTHIWAGLKRAFQAAFLPTDYLTEVEDQLKAMVQGPDQTNVFETLYMTTEQCA